LTNKTEYNHVAHAWIWSRYRHISYSLNWTCIHDNLTDIEDKVVWRKWIYQAFNFFFLFVRVLLSPSLSPKTKKKCCTYKNYFEESGKGSQETRESISGEIKVGKMEKKNSEIMYDVWILHFYFSLLPWSHFFLGKDL